MGNIGRNEEVISSGVDRSVKKCVCKMISIDLSQALKLQNVGQYYCFPSKDDAVAACAGEASFLLEDGSGAPSLINIYIPKRLLRIFS